MARGRGGRWLGGRWLGGRWLGGRWLGGQHCRAAARQPSKEKTARGAGRAPRTARGRTPIQGGDNTASGRETGLASAMLEPRYGSGELPLRRFQVSSLCCELQRYLPLPSRERVGERGRPGRGGCVGGRRALPPLPRPPLRAPALWPAGHRALRRAKQCFAFSACAPRGERGEKLLRPAVCGDLNRGTAFTPGIAPPPPSIRYRSPAFPSAAPCHVVQVNCSCYERQRSLPLPSRERVGERGRPGRGGYVGSQRALPPLPRPLSRKGRGEKNRAARWSEARYHAHRIGCRTHV